MIGWLTRAVAALALLPAPAASPTRSGGLGCGRGGGSAAAGGPARMALEGQVLALDGSTRVYLSVNRTGTVLWPALAAGATREELLARLVERFDVGDDAAARDLD